MYLAFEVTRDFKLSQQEVEVPAFDERDPLRSTSGSVLHGRKTALVPILRSGLTLCEGMLEAMPNARIGHLGISRKEPEDTTKSPTVHEAFNVIEYLVSLPDPSERNFILIDSVISTGTVASHAISTLKGAGIENSRIRFAAILAAPEGLRKLSRDHPDVRIFPVCVESELDKHHRVIPGFGDAADRQFGTGKRRTT